MNKRITDPRNTYNVKASNHAKLRALQRYGIWLNDDDMKKIVEQITAEIGGFRELQIRVQVDMEAPLLPQIEKIIEEANESINWMEEEFVAVVPPGLGTAAYLIGALFEIYPRAAEADANASLPAHFPFIRLKQDRSSPVSGKFILAGIE